MICLKSKNTSEFYSSSLLQICSMAKNARNFDIPWALEGIEIGPKMSGTDSMPSFMMRLIHIGDTMTLVNLDTFGSRLASAGFRDAIIEVTKERFRFRAKRPL
jgi:hypothetical protein